MLAVVHWKRVILAGFLSELGVVIAISVVIVTYRFLIAKGLSAAEYDEFGQRAGYYVAAPSAALLTFGMAYWAVRSLESDFVVNGLLVGVVATLLAAGFIFGARREDRAMYIASFIVRIAAGCIGGLIARHLKG